MVFKSISINESGILAIKFSAPLVHLPIEVIDLSVGRQLGQNITNNYDIDEVFDFEINELDYWVNQEDKDKSIKDFYLTKVSEDRDTIFIKIVFTNSTFIAQQPSDRDSMNVKVIRPDLFIDAVTGISLSLSDSTKFAVPLVPQLSDAELAEIEAITKAVAQAVNMTLVIYAFLLLLAGKVAG